MAKFHYDLTGAEPIIRDMAVYDATSLQIGEFVMMDATAAEACRLITSYNATSSNECVDGAGIMNEKLTTTSPADKGDGITTAQTTTAAAVSSVAATLAQGHRYGKVIINPFAVFLTEYSQAAADDFALTQTWSTTALTLTSLEDNIDGGWLLAADQSTTSNFEGQLRYIDTAGGSSVTVTVAPTVAGGTSDTLIKIHPVATRVTALDTSARYLRSTAAANTGTMLQIVENYIGGKWRPLEPMKVGNLTRSGTTDTACDLGAGAKAYADVLQIDHLYNYTS